MFSKPVNHSTMRLGKGSARRDARNFKLASYTTPADLPTPPKSCDWSRAVVSAGVPFEMYHNDAVGNCTLAAAAHMVQVWTANASTDLVLTDKDVLDAYTLITGYDPARPETDNGAVLLDVLKYWRLNGIGGHKIGAFVEINPRDHDEVRLASFLFGGVYAGFQLPKSCQHQDVWDYDPGAAGSASGSWGGHCINITGLNRNLLFWDRPRCITWGATKDMTWNFVDRYADEAYAIVSEDWIRNNQKSPSGFDMMALMSDLQRVTQV